MIQKKVCILGAFGVGKTSLVARFVHSKFSEKYISTMGVKIDRKQVEVNGDIVNLMLWDIHGEEEYKQIPVSYLRGASGIMTIIDGTRPDTLDTAKNILQRVEDELGHIPNVYLINKHDLSDAWSIRDDDIQALSQGAMPVHLTSAKTGANVELAFQQLTKALIV